MVTEYKGFGAYLLGLRKNKGVTEEIVSAAIGVATEEYNCWEKGEKRPSDEQLKLLSDFFGIPQGRFQIYFKLPDFGKEENDYTDEEKAVLAAKSEALAKRRYLIGKTIVFTIVAVEILWALYSFFVLKNVWKSYCVILVAVALWYGDRRTSIIVMLWKSALLAMSLQAGDMPQEQFVLQLSVIVVSVIFALVLWKSRAVGEFLYGRSENPPWDDNFFGV